eukprot:TRINITY_DN1947_c0_g1_i2.p1 TRINITY_DN1947_c0_g1~~TRINITY_DN1947_c0_g1_i2.p1  ORF type:complete len:131 (-),score=21.75 TRINITY_DN1947_c0_g1_i2:114-506(-)
MATVYSGFSSALAFIVFTVSFSALHVYGGLIPISPFKFCDFAFKGKELFIPEFDLKAKGDNDLFLLPLVTKTRELGAGFGAAGDAEETATDSLKRPVLYPRQQGGITNIQRCVPAGGGEGQRPGAAPHRV